MWSEWSTCHSVMCMRALKARVVDVVSRCIGRAVVASVGGMRVAFARGHLRGVDQPAPRDHSSRRQRSASAYGGQTHLQVLDLAVQLGVLGAEGGELGGLAAAAGL